MNEENVLVITDREELYDKCENMEQLFDKYYLPLLDKHYSKTYKLQQENARLKDKIEKAIMYIENTYDDVLSSFTEDKPMTNFKARKELLEILKEN